MVRTANAVRYLESAVTAAAGTVLRYGLFYGPGTGFEYMLGMPLIGDGAGVWSFIHTDDAAAATLAAIERGAPGLYNVVDDTPVPIGEWLPRLAPEPPARLSEADGLPDPRRGDGPPAHPDPGPVERQGAARARLGSRSPQRLRGRASRSLTGRRGRRAGPSRRRSGGRRASCRPAGRPTCRTARDRAGLPVTSNGDVLWRLPSAAASTSGMRARRPGCGRAFIAVVGSTARRSARAPRRSVAFSRRPRFWALA